LTEDCFLTNKELYAAARFQADNLNRVTHPCGYQVSKFITMVMRSRSSKNTNQIGADPVLPEVYMVSDQAEALFKSDMFDDVKDRSTKIKFKAPSKDP